MWKKIKEKLLFAFLGIDSQRDEYQETAIRHILSQTGLAMWLSNLGLLLILIVQDQRNGTASFATIALLIITNLASIYVVYKLYRQQLNVTEFETEAEFQRFRRQRVLKAYLNGACLGGVIYFALGIVFPLLVKDPIVISLWEFIITILVSWLGIGSILALLAVSRLKKYYEE